eukprot:Em0005g763a
MDATDLFDCKTLGYLRIVTLALKSFVGGGALDVYNCLTTEIVDCSFEDNYATSVIQDSQYRGKRGRRGHRSHVPLGQFSFGRNSVTANFQIMCSSQTALSYVTKLIMGGGAYVLPALSPGDGYYVSFENSLFDGNYASEYAAAIGFGVSGILPVLHCSPSIQDHQLCIQNNMATTGGIIGVPYIPVVMDGHNVFTNNTGATLRGQRYSQEGTAISFHGNHGRLGAAFVTEYSPEVPGFTKLLYNPLCFIRYEDNQLSPFLWEGDGSNRNLGHPSESIGDRTFYVQTPAASLHIESTSFSVFAGETVPLKLESLDEMATQPMLSSG